MAQFINVREFHATYTQWLDQAERGGSVIITRRGKPIAALVPVDLERMGAAVGEVEW